MNDGRSAPRDNEIRGRLRRIRALVRKETLQVVRDPSSLVVAFILPALLLTLFGFGVSFDATRMRVGLVAEEPTPETEMFVASLSNTRYFHVQRSADRRMWGAFPSMSWSALSGSVSSIPSYRSQNSCDGEVHWWGRGRLVWTRNGFPAPAARFMNSIA